MALPIMLIPNPSAFRENVVRKFAESLVALEDKHAVNLEKGIFNYTIQESNFRKIVKKWENPAFVQLYMDKLRSVFLNMKNEDLLHAIREGEIATQTVAFMTHQEMDPVRWKPLLERKRAKDASKVTSNVQASTDMYTCKKCRSKRCTYYELQTRSADEPTTIFITCLDCGKNWKIC
jgi:transcription elongation factor S-II